MTYPKELTEYHKLILDPIFKKLRKAAPGEVIFFTYQTASYCDRVRQTFYAWRAIHNKKHAFKIRRLSQTLLAIEVLHFEEPSVSDTRLRPFEEFVIDNLLDIGTEKEAIKLIQDSSLPPNEKVEAIIEWRRIAG